MNIKENHGHSTYLSPIFDDATTFQKTVSKTSIYLRKQIKEGLKFDYIACSGVSGIAIAAPVAFSLKKGLIVVRKPKEEFHGSYSVEGCPQFKAFKYVVIDDLVESGKTLDRIVSSIDAENSYSECVGVKLYYYGEMWDAAKTRYYLNREISYY